MPASLFRSVPGRRAGKTGSASRCGAVIARIVKTLWLAALLAACLHSAPLSPGPDPGGLLPRLQEMTFFDARPHACSRDGGCVIQLPEARLPEVLAAPMRPQLPAAVARILLPSGARWMLASSNGRGPLVAPAAVVMRAPRAGEPPRVESSPFDLVTRADRLHVAAMFLIGLVLLMGSTALGLIVRHPAEPVIPGLEEPLVPEAKILPRLVTSPVAAPTRPQP